MNVLRLERTRDAFGLDSVVVFVDGQRLFCEGGCGPPLAVARSHLVGVLADDHPLWGDPLEFDDGRVPVAACTCAVPACDSLVARIVVTDDRVLWTAISQCRPMIGPCRDYVPAGRLVFDRAQYVSEIERVIGPSDGLADVSE